MKTGGDWLDRTPSIGDCVDALRDIGAAVGVPSALHHLPDLVKQVREMAERAESRDTRLAAAEGQAAAAVEEVRALRAAMDTQIAKAVTVERRAIGVWVRAPSIGGDRQSRDFIASSIERGDHTNNPVEG